MTRLREIFEKGFYVRGNPSARYIEFSEKEWNKLRLRIYRIYLLVALFFLSMGLIVGYINTK